VQKSYQKLFEDAVNEQAAVVGSEAARDIARRAGLIVSPSGRVTGCREAPQLVLLRLVTAFTKTGSLRALSICAPLIDEARRDLTLGKRELNGAAETAICDKLP